MELLWAEAPAGQRAGQRAVWGADHQRDVAPRARQARGASVRRAVSHAAPRHRPPDGAPRRGGCSRGGRANHQSALRAPRKLTRHEQHRQQQRCALEGGHVDDLVGSAAAERERWSCAVRGRSSTVAAGGAGERESGEGGEWWRWGRYSYTAGGARESSRGAQRAALRLPHAFRGGRAHVALLSRQLPPGSSTFSSLTSRGGGGAAPPRTALLSAKQQLQQQRRPAAAGSPQRAGPSQDVARAPAAAAAAARSCPAGTTAHGLARSARDSSARRCEALRSQTTPAHLTRANNSQQPTHGTVQQPGQQPDCVLLHIVLQQ